MGREPLWLLTSQRSLETMENDQWAIDDHGFRANFDGGLVGPWHFRGWQNEVFWMSPPPLTRWLEYSCRIGFSVKMRVERYLDEPGGT